MNGIQNRKIALRQSLIFLVEFLAEGGWELGQM